jgi:GNAT superfamily N-acetyltransferase
LAAIRCDELGGVRVTVTVRRATAADAPALARLRWQWRTDERAESRPDLHRDTFCDFFASWVIDHLDTHLPFVVEVGGRLAGSAWLVLADRVPSVNRPDRRTADIQSVYVVPELRDSGVGGALLAALVAEARARELEHVTVHSSERAVPFYLRGGFEQDPRWLQFTP